ncbi:hypothetical protein CMQ_5626 [Grosmannia clavigera kw1407]|uniref:Uncharacterized protein n=1 Tax=Grosmannia clavigera (strain kw1407 / UAMH 11150) TaxID=655863 RepID=F0XSZ7_GROCL|nr:uncharacterized protein CMQ_5626 [Grosmannia clavigera kw1407]EFW99205.1 hypothetical protein CMQ_5626 [Grosmannia clavigera kw1407]
MEAVGGAGGHLRSTCGAPAEHEPAHRSTLRGLSSGLFSGGGGEEAFFCAGGAGGRESVFSTCAAKPVAPPHKRPSMGSPRAAGSPGAAQRTQHSGWAAQLTWAPVLGAEQAPVGPLQRSHATAGGRPWRREFLCAGGAGGRESVFSTCAAKPAAPPHKRPSMGSPRVVGSPGLLSASREARFIRLEPRAYGTVRCPGAVALVRPLNQDAGWRGGGISPLRAAVGLLLSLGIAARQAEATGDTLSPGTLHQLHRRAVASSLGG